MINYGYLILSLLITAFVYLFFPVFYRANEGRVSVKKGRKMSLLNAVAGCAIFCIIRGIISGGEEVFGSFASAVTYYFIGCWILCDKKKKDEPSLDKESNTQEKNKENESVQSNNENNDKQENCEIIEEKNDKDQTQKKE